jgi:hypothetical protein
VGVTTSLGNTLSSHSHGAEDDVDELENAVVLID